MRAGAVLLTGIAGAGLMLAACHPAKFGELRNERSLLVSSRLICPNRQGELDLRESSGDGRSCRYAGEDGTEVTLQLASLDGKPAQAALGEVEARLREALPAPPPADAAESGGNTMGGNSLAGGGSWTSDDDGDDDRGRNRDRHGKIAYGDGDEAHINLPFLHIDAHGDRAQVNMPGVHINANGKTAQVEVNKPGGKLVTVHADDRGAEIRTGDITPKNVDVTYMLATRDRDGVKDQAFGYIAKGPIAGPLVLATVKGRREDGDSDDGLFHAVKKLVNRNVRRG